MHINMHFFRLFSFPPLSKKPEYYSQWIKEWSEQEAWKDTNRSLRQ